MGANEVLTVIRLPDLNPEKNHSADNITDLGVEGKVGGYNLPNQVLTVSNR